MHVTKVEDYYFSNELLHSPTQAFKATELIPFSDKEMDLIDRAAERRLADYLWIGLNGRNLRIPVRLAEGLFVKQDYDPVQRCLVDCVADTGRQTVETVRDGVVDALSTRHVECAIFAAIQFLSDEKFPPLMNRIESISLDSARFTLQVKSSLASGDFQLMLTPDIQMWFQPQETSLTAHKLLCAAAKDSPVTYFTTLQRLGVDVEAHFDRIRVALNYAVQVRCSASDLPEALAFNDLVIWFNSSGRCCIADLTIAPFAHGGEKEVRYLYLEGAHCDIGAISVNKLQRPPYRCSAKQQLEYNCVKTILSAPEESTTHLVRPIQHSCFPIGVFTGTWSYAQCMHLYSGGTLQSCSPSGDRELINWAIQCCTGLSELHQLKYLHGDLKPENFFVTYPPLGGDARVDLGDFGWSRPIASSFSEKLGCGTTIYCAPEVLNGSCYGVKADIYSLGITLLEIALGVRLVGKGIANRTALLDLFKRGEERQLSSVVITLLTLHPFGNTAWINSHPMHPHYTLIASDCTHFDPEQRPTLPEIIARLAELSDE